MMHFAKLLLLDSFKNILELALKNDIKMGMYTELKSLQESIKKLNNEILNLNDRQKKSIMKSEKEKYVKLIISMSTDFFLGKIDFNHYANTLDIINTNIQNLNK